MTFVCYRAYDYCVISLEMKMQEALYRQIFGYIHRHSFQFFTEHFAGSLISKIRKCVSSVERLTDMLAWELIPFVLNLVLIVGILWFEHRGLAIGVFVGAVGFSIAQYRLYRWIQPYQERANAVDSELGGILSDTISNNQTIKFFASLAREELAFASCVKELADARRTQYFKSMWIWGASALFAMFLELGTIYVAIQLWGQGVLEIGVIVLLQTYVLRVIDQVWSIGMTFRNFFRVVVEIDEVVELLEIPHQVQDYSDKNLNIHHGKIVFDSVDFRYGEHQIFDRLSFEIGAGERVALVGESGSGKTTITKLLFRLYDREK
ncbi:MAG: ABC transporter ATP-binding protein [bacterium]|nr:ABC transporter ATP-binding protein [bacterium]